MLPLARASVFKLSIAIACVATLFPAQRLNADAGASSEVQVIILRKILSYDTLIGDATKAKILIIFSEDKKAEAEGFSRACAKAELSASMTSITNYAEPIKSAQVVVILAPSVPKEMGDLFVSHRILSVATSSEYAERGEAALAIGLRADRKPEIVVHLDQLKKSGHQLSSALLSLARVIR